nr:ribonuclease H-like domain-containing protein [Tanacetum cinerariifolium]
MHKAFSLPVIEFPLAEEVPIVSEESSHYQKKRDATAKIIALLNLQRLNSAESLLLHKVIEFGDSYEVPTSAVTTETASDGTGKKSGRTVTVTTEDIQKRKNDVKARTTLLLSLPDEYQLRFIKYKTAQELCAAILKTFGGNEATKKTKKNLRKQHGSQIKFEDINQIDKDDMEEMDIKWNMALLSMRADRAPRSQDRGRRDNYRQGSKVEEQAPKALMAIDGVGWDWSYMANDEENHALFTDEEAPTEFALMANTSAESKVFDNSLCYKDCKKNTDSLNSKITDLTDKLFDAKNMIYHYKLRLAQVESRLVEHKDREIKYCEKIRGLELDVQFKTNKLECLAKELKTLKKEKEGSDKNKDGLGYSAVPPPLAQIYSSLKKDLSWTGLPEFKDDTVTDYSRPAPTVESSPDDAQNRNPSVTEEASPGTISPKSLIKFVKANDSSTNSKIDKAEKAKKSLVKKFPTGGTKFSTADMGKKGKAVKPSACYWDSGCSRHMIGNISYLSDYEPFDGGYVSFDQGGCKITGKGTIKTGKLEFENVYFMKDLKYNLFSVSQICDNKNSVLFTDSECIVLGRGFKLLDDANILLRTPRQHNMYSIDLNNIIPHKDLTCLVAKASADE